MPTNVDELADVEITFYSTMLVLLNDDPWTSISQTMNRGEHLTITEEIIAASKDRFGNSWLELLDDEAAQERRWGKPMFTRGKVVLDPWERRGDPVWAQHRDRARAAAHALVDPNEKAAAFRAIDKRFGKAPTDGQTLGWYLR